MGEMHREGHCNKYANLIHNKRYSIPFPNYRIISHKSSVRKKLINKYSEAAEMCINTRIYVNAIIA